MRLPMAIGSHFTDFCANFTVNQPLKKLLYFLPSSTRRIYSLSGRSAILILLKHPLAGRGKFISFIGTC